MVKKKGKSKRITLKDKYKIQRRVVETHRKNRKQAKRDAKAGIIHHDKKKKDPGIPNSWPFKQELLQDIRRSNKREEQKNEEEKQRRNQLRKDGAPSTLADLMIQANQKQSQFDARHGMNKIDKDNDVAIRITKPSHGQQSRRAYLRELKKVIDASDVILQVLDSRDPLGTRIHPSIEAGILSFFDKRMVLVMNKIDLIPKTNVSEWLAYLRRSHPTVAVKAGTCQSTSKESGKSSGIGQTKGDNALSSSSAVGVDGLLQLLKNYARAKEKSKNVKTCISVGIIGYPNVGKSSILNSLKRFRAVGVSPRPGFTTSMQEVVLDKNIRLIDSPGVVFDDDESKLGAGVILRNSIDADSVEDPIPAVEELLRRCSMESLMMTYNIPAFPKDDVMAFLAMTAKSRQKVLKGGIPDKVMAARFVIRDWNKGKIPFFSSPPDNRKDGGTGMVTDINSVKIVSSFSDEFDVNKILADHDAELTKELEDTDEIDFVQVRSCLASQEEDKARHQKFVNFLVTGQDTDRNVDEGPVCMDEDSEDIGNAPPPTNAQMEDIDDFEFEE